MDRRAFLKNSALCAAAASAAQDDTRKFTLANKYLAWELEAGSAGLRSTACENRISGRRFALAADPEFALVLSAAVERIEIPWWDFRVSPNGGEPYHLRDVPGDGWGKAHNLAGRGGGRVYEGYGWFRHDFALPGAARGTKIVFVLGGYDQQDWSERWVYVNGEEIGHHSSSGRWRSPGQFVLEPSDPRYASLEFGSSQRNTLAVKNRHYDLHFAGIREQALERYVFRPWLMDQFISVGDPYLRVTEFTLDNAKQLSAEKLEFNLRNAAGAIRLQAHYELDGSVRRKWLEVRNEGAHERLLLDVELDAFGIGASLSEGGHGDPVFAGDEAFCAVEHPSGINQGGGGRVKLWHCPARRIAPGATFRTQTAVFGMAAPGAALEQFHSHLLNRSPRAQKKVVSIYTTFGINNQWGACPTLSDTEVLDVQGVVKSWQDKGLRLSYFTIDSGWPDNQGDLKEFTPTCYPEGPGQIVRGVDALGMKFGLWFSVSWGGWSCGSYPPVQPSTIPDPGEPDRPPVDPPVGAYRNGYPVSGGVGRQLCIASEPYFRVFRDAVVHHVRNNKVRLLKFDSGNYYCNSTAHGHLPGKYSVEAMHDRLIEIAAAARAAAPDVFVIWYWGLSSPFWALHGDAIFESGLFMEGSATSFYPSLYYRDSVTLSLDQNTQFAKLIPPMNKDSLGVWLSQIRWGNFMGKERWREALVMDLGRGNLIFPQLWGDPYLLNEADVRFMADLSALVRANERVFLSRRRTFGDSWENEPYGYSFSDGVHGFLFAHNMHFAARKMEIPREFASGAGVEIASWFPAKERVVPERGGEIWLRPFETLMLEIRPASGRTTAGLPPRAFSERDATGYGIRLPLAPAQRAAWMELRFADGPQLEKTGKQYAVKYFSTSGPAISGGRHVLAIAVRLRRGAAEYRYAPAVAAIVQMRVAIGGHVVQLVPVPDARQFGNTQSAGCSWVVYKFPLAARHSGQPLEFAVHAYLPKDVEPEVEAWVVRQWWLENTRPQADGYYGDAPS